MVNKKIIVAVVASVLALGIILLCILLPLSYSYVHFNEYAFKKNTLSNQVDTAETFEGGRYFWGLSAEPTSFPSTYQVVKFRGRDLLVFTKNGLEFELEADVYYRISKDGLAAIYGSFGLQYASRFADAIRASIKNYATTYSLDEYIQNRSIVSAGLATGLRQDLGAQGLEIELGKFHLLRYNLPQNLQNKFLTTAVQETTNDIVLLQQKVDLIKKETERLTEVFQANITVTSQTAEATALVLVKNAESEASKIRLQATGLGLAELFKSLNITSAEDRKKVFDYMLLLDSTTSQRVLVGEIAPFINV